MTSQGVLLLETGPWNQGQGVLVLEHVLQLETIRYFHVFLIPRNHRILSI